MKESIGYTVSLNIMIVFIAIIVAFLCAALIYFKSNKVSNVITASVEKYEGYNDSSKSEISMQLSSIGYNVKAITCKPTIYEVGVADESGNVTNQCYIQGSVSERGKQGYCVYRCNEANGKYYYYKIRTNMMISIPIIHNFLDIPIYSNTNRLYKFR
jgi:hypothetical protein